MRVRNVCAALARYELELVVLLAVGLWLPRPGWLVPLIGIPLLWLARGLAQGRPTPRTPFDRPLGVIACTLPLTLLPIVRWSPALSDLAGLSVGIGLVFALASRVRRPADLVRLAQSLLPLVGLALALVGIVGTEWKDGVIASLWPLYDRLPRLSHGVSAATPNGLLHPNELGGALAVLVPPTLALAMGAPGARHPPRRATAFALAALVALTAALGLSQSRGAIASAAVGCGLVAGWWLLAAPASGRLRLAAALPAALLAAATLWTGARVALATASGGGIELESLPSRLEIWHRALLMICDFPLTGIGRGQFPLVLYELYVPVIPLPAYFPPHAHNVVLQLALDFGIVGAAAWLWILGIALRGLTRIGRTGICPGVQAFAVGLVGGLVTWLSFGLLDALVLGAPHAIGFWLVLGLGGALIGCATPGPIEGIGPPPATTSRQRSDLFGGSRPGPTDEQVSVASANREAPVQ